MYANCGALAEADKGLAMTRRNGFTWTAFISEYAVKGEAQNCLNCYERMRLDGVSPNAVTFASVLKACGSIKASDKGQRVYNDIVREGLLGTDVVLGNSLINMLAKCGALAKAEQVLEQLPARDVFSWSALISGYVQHSQGEQALKCFQYMQQDGIIPNEVTFSCVLKACGSIESAIKGFKIHNIIIRLGLLGVSIILGNALVNMYAKCHALARALQVLEELPSRDVISWNALIVGYAQQGEGEKALNCLKRMELDGFSPNATTYACILKACGSLGALAKGEEIHDEIARQGMLINDNVLGTALVDMYIKCGALTKAQQVLEQYVAHDAVPWSVLIAGYCQRGQWDQAIACYQQMHSQGLSHNEATFACILRAYGSIGTTDKGKEIHDEISRQGLLKNSLMLGTALVELYAHCGVPTKAQQVLEELSVRDVVSWSALIKGYARQGQGLQALHCFERMQYEGLYPKASTLPYILKACGSSGKIDKGESVHVEIARQGLLESNIVLGNTLIDMYAKCGAIAQSQEMLEKLPVRDIISWNALITGYAKQNQGKEALECFEQLQHEGLSPNAITFTCALQACVCIGAADEGEKIHDMIVREQLLNDDIVLGNTLIDMYVKFGAVSKARQLLEELPVRDVFSWSTLINGYAEQGDLGEAQNCVDCMAVEGFSPNGVTFSCILKACARFGAADKGQQIHDEIARQGLLGANLVLGTTLVDMYAKCGALSRAQEVLEGLPVRDVVAWSMLLEGFVKQGCIKQTLHCLEGMHHEGFSPDASAFSCLLSACSHLGLVADAQKYVAIMSTACGIEPNLEHCTCLLDLFGRVGHLDKAFRVIEKMSSLCCVVWSALLGACKRWGDVSLGRWAYEHAIQVDKSDPALYDLMTSIYLAAACKPIQKTLKHETQNEALCKPVEMVVPFCLGIS